jgi:hypothetical protein
MDKLVRNVVCVVAMVVTSYAGTAQAQVSSMKDLQTTIYGGVGLNFYSVSVAGFSDTSTRFGIHAGAKAAYRLSDMWSGVGLVNAAVTFGDDQTPVPLTVAAGIQLDKVIPVDLTLGLGFTFVAGFTGANPIGLAILGQGFYPLPKMGFGVFLQLQENILNNDLNLFQMSAGVGYRF